MPSYRTWVVIQRREKMLTEILRASPRVRLDDRPPVSLTCIGDKVELKMANPDAVLEGIQYNQPLRAISSAPIEDILQFHGKRFQNWATRYEIQCDVCNPKIPPSPYANRFLSIVALGPGVSVNADDRRPVVKEVPAVPNLWLWPEEVQFSSGDVDNYFSDGGPATQLVDSFFLPPVRCEEGTGAPENYFSPEFCELRQDIRKVIRAGAPVPTDPYQDPVALTMTRLTDDLTVRDALLDGSMLKWTSVEGDPTEIELHVACERTSASFWRSKVLCEPGHGDFSEWVQPLTAILADDVRALLPKRGLRIQPLEPIERQDWAVSPVMSNPADGQFEKGSWAYLSDLHDSLENSSESWSVMFERVLRPTQALTGQEFPDHDEAEKLFMEIAWRCPWPYKPVSRTIDAWRRAFRSILLTELSRNFPTPEGRVDTWNIASKKLTPLFTPLRRDDEPHPRQFVVRYAGEPNDDEVSAWRLELPWRAVVQARTLILNSRSRSRLDSAYVLA